MQISLERIAAGKPGATFIVHFAQARSPRLSVADAIRLHAELEVALRDHLAARRPT